MAPRSLILLLLHLSIPIPTLGIGEAGDEAALLAFKSAAISGGAYSGSLASWNSSSDGGVCSWEGVTCGRRHRRVVALSLTSHVLTGVLSPAIGNLSFLRALDLSDNGLRGHIPASLGRLRHLRRLNLSHNTFSGEILANLSSCTRLTVISLQKNQLQGRVPSELGGKLTHLEELTLWGNNLTGTIPASLANLSSLSSLELALNQLDGAIPPDLGHILGLQYLGLAFNYLSGEPPVSLYNLSLLQALQIQGNMLHGGIPTNIGSKFPNMRILAYAENQLTGSIPASLSNLTTLELLDLSRNRLTGYVPRILGTLEALERLYLYINTLEANSRGGWEFISSLSNCSRLQYLVIGHNAAFVGQLPSSIVNLSATLQVLALDETGISGSIPSDISNLASLELLGLSNTSISQRVPDSIGKLGSLIQLRLYNTHLSGLIPSSIGNLSQLTVLKAYNCNLEGPIPATIGKLKNLFVLDLSTNRLNGSIPVEIFKLPLLSRFLNLSYNSLSGPLPSEVSSMGNLNNLVLSGNHLSGEIPDGIGECTVLQGLWLDNNSFEGSIPQSINKINGLIALNLSMNKLSGTIPIGIGSIRNLQQLYMAHNNLSGTIPTDLAVTGNNELCGGIPQLHLAPCHNSSAKKDRKGHLKALIIALSAIGGLLSLALVIPFIQFFYNKLREKQKSLLQPQIIDEQYERVSYHILANGTNGFSEASLLGEGSFGAVYKCHFPDEGTIVAVKVFNLEQSGSSRSFVAECEAMRRVRHRCLLKIITCCSSIDHQGEEFKALIFEFMPNGSLYVWLHPESDMLNSCNTLSLTQRLNIAVDIMDALDYLHNHCQPPIIHCDLKPSNILLAEDMSARVGDFGISKILPESASTT